jgi:outer membrane receptor for ferrienterochelin and colicin
MVSGKTIKTSVTILLFALSSQILSQIADSTLAAIYSMDLEELMNTKITIATKSEKPINESPSTVSVITSDEIKNMGARELADILQTIPGFDISIRFTGEYGVGLRGVKDSKTSSKILLMVDGIPVNQIFYGNSIQGYEMNTDIIDRIEIIRGPGSALYGRNAFSGVINVITKNGNTQKGGLVKATLGNFNTKCISGYYGFKKEKFNASFAVKRLYTDVSDSKLTEDSVVRRWNLFHDNLNINSTLSFGKFTFSGAFNNLVAGGVLTNTFYTYRTGYYSLSYHNDLSPKLSVGTEVYGYNAFYCEDIEQVRPDKDPKYPLGFYVRPEVNEYLYGFESEIKYKFSSNDELLFGIQADIHGVKNVLLYTNADFRYDSLPAIPGIGRNNLPLSKVQWFVNDGHSYNNLALFVQNVWYPFKNLGITIGGRFDFDSQIGGVFNPRTGIVYEPYKNLVFKLLYGRAYRAPAPSEQYQYFGYATGNQDLNPEIINSTEFGLSYRYKTTTQSVSIFQNYLTDMIYAASLNSVDPDNKYYNIGKNSSRGIEYENKVVMGKNLYAWLNYSYIISENTDLLDSKDSVYAHQDIAPHKLNLGLNASLLKYFNLNAYLFYRSKMEKFLVPDGDNMVAVQDKIGGYTIINSTLRIEHVIKNLSTSISVYNLLNTKYYSQDNEHLHLPSQPGRQILVSASFVF